MPIAARGRVLPFRHRRMRGMGNASDVAGQFAQALQPIINATANQIQYGQGSPYAPSPYVPVPEYPPSYSQTPLSAHVNATASAGTWIVGGLVLMGALWVLSRGVRL